MGVTAPGGGHRLGRPQLLGWGLGPLAGGLCAGEEGAPPCPSRPSRDGRLCGRLCRVGGDSLQSFVSPGILCGSRSRLLFDCKLRFYFSAF